MTRDQILEAAAQIFRTKGFHAASMRDIAEAVALQKASLYHHFSSKQEILLELLDQGLDLLTSKLIEICSQPLLPEEKLRAAMRSYLQNMTDHLDLAAVLLLEHRSLAPELRARHTKRRDRFEKLWRDLIQEGVNTGIFSCPDPAMASRILLGSMNWAVTWYRPDGPLSAGEIADQCADLFFRGLLVRDKSYI